MEAARDTSSTGERVEGRGGTSAPDATPLTIARPHRRRSTRRSDRSSSRLKRATSLARPGPSAFALTRAGARPTTLTPHMPARQPLVPRHAHDPARVGQQGAHPVRVGPVRRGHVLQHRGTLASGHHRRLWRRQEGRLHPRPRAQGNDVQGAHWGLRCDCKVLISLALQYYIEVRLRSSGRSYGTAS